MVGAYLLNKVEDQESSLPDKQVPQYVTVLSPYKDGLPYDFNQVRVFTWNTKKHRYETAYRLRDLQGYLPVKVTTQNFDKVGPEPVFSFKTATDDAVAIDPATGPARPANTATLTFRLEGAIVKKGEPPSATPPPAPQPAPSASNAKSTQPITSSRHSKRHAEHHVRHHRRHEPK